MPDENRPGRPDMPRGYGISKSDEGLMPWSWVDEQMAKSRNYWVCSTRADGRPHAAPVWGVWFERTLYFASDRQARKARNLASNPEVVIHLESGDNAVILEGAVEEVRDKALLLRIVVAYAAKYPPFKPDPSPGPNEIWFSLRPRVALAWLESDFPNTATRWQFELS